MVQEYGVSYRLLNNLFLTKKKSKNELQVSLDEIAIFGMIFQMCLINE